MTRVLVALCIVPTVLMLLLYVDASFGHDGLHCELGWAWSEYDNACGGFWR